MAELGRVGLGQAGLGSRMGRSGGTFLILSVASVPLSARFSVVVDVLAPEAAVSSTAFRLSVTFVGSFSIESRGSLLPIATALRYKRRKDSIW